jgi:hypothetical protein
MNIGNYSAYGAGIPSQVRFSARQKPQATSTLSGRERPGKPSWHQAAAYLLAGAMTQFSLTSCSTAPVAGVPLAPDIQADGAIRLSAEDKKRFHSLEAEFIRLQSLPVASEDRQKGIKNLRMKWDKLRDEATHGDVTAKALLMALWVNRMREEVVAPSQSLIRFYDPSHDNLLRRLADGELSPQKFRAAMQLRGLQGLSSYYGTTDPDQLNPLALKPSALYETLMGLLQGGRSRGVYNRSIRLLMDGFQDFTPAQQQKFLSHLTSTFLDSKNPTQKFQAMVYLGYASKINPDLPLWKSLSETVRQKLQQAAKADEQKFWIVFLGLQEAPDLPELLRSVCKPGSPANTQRAVAWALGRSHSIDALSMLENILGDRNFHPLAQEMAMYSLAEFYETAPERVMETIQRYAPEPGKAATGKKHRIAVEEAARAMREKLDERPRTESDYYVHKLLTSEPERQEYRSLRDRYLRGWALLDVAQKNMVDRSLIPFRQFLPEVLKKGGRHEFVKHAVTEAEGKRSHVGFRHRDGRLEDSLEGISSPGGIAVTALTRLQPGKENVFAHELIHHLMQLVWGPQGQDADIFFLYHQKRFIDNYAATNWDEYSAESGEALDSLYKNHELLFHALFENGYGDSADNNRIKLKRIDPKVFDFLKNKRSIPLELARQMTDWYRSAPLAGWGLPGKNIDSPFVDRA